MKKTVSRVIAVVASTALIGTVLVIGAPPALADQVMGGQEGDPLTVRVTPDLNCAVNHTGDTAGEFYGDTACGTFVFVNSTLYGPANVSFGPTPRTAFTSVGTQTLSGTGTSADPQTIVTTVDVGSTGLHITQTDTYVSGRESYRTSVQVTNSSGSPISAQLYRAGDCFLQDSDFGFGAIDSSTGAVSCVGAAPGSNPPTPGDRIIQWFPISSGSHHLEDGYSQLWSAVASGNPLPDTCQCDSYIDNGSGLSWAITVPANGSVTRSQITTFSPLGIQPLSTSKIADDSVVSTGQQTGYTITVHNPNVADVTLDDVTDTLPNGFTYVPGSTTDGDDNAVANPSIEGSDLTWSGPFTVPSGGDFSLHFNVDASNTPGDYTNQAGADAANNYSVAPTGPTAQITVEAPPINADLQISKSDAAPNGPDPVTAGNNVSYQIDVTNNGPDNATGVAVTDDLPPGTSFVSATGDGWTCDFDSESDTVFCHSDGLVEGGASSINVILQAPNPAPSGCDANESLSSCITDSATVDFYGPDDQFDPNPDNNTATETTEVQPRPANPDESTGYVPPEGGTVTTGNNPNSTDTTDATTKLPPGPGGVVDIQEETPPPDLCVNGCTGQAVVIQIPDGYTDGTLPPKVILKYDVTVVRPKGGAKIYIQKDSQPPVLVPPCIKHGEADPHPCVGSRQRLPNGDLKVTVLLLSGDPIFGKH